MFNQRHRIPAWSKNKDLATGALGSYSNPATEMTQTMQRIGRASWSCRTHYQGQSRKIEQGCQKTNTFVGVNYSYLFIISPFPCPTPGSSSPSADWGRFLPPSPRENRNIRGAGGAPRAAAAADLGPWPGRRWEFRPWSPSILLVASIETIATWEVYFFGKCHFWRFHQGKWWKQLLSLTASIGFPLDK